MSQFILSVFQDPGVLAAGAYATEEEMQKTFAKVAAFNKELQSSGAFVFACGLLPPEGARQVSPGGEITAGPRGEGPFVGGFWVINTATEAEALQAASRAAEACGQGVEVRQLQG